MIAVAREAMRNSENLLTVDERTVTMMKVLSPISDRKITKKL